MSPDGSMIVTGAGDETLRFWNIRGKNDKGKAKKKEEPSKLDLSIADMR